MENPRCRDERPSSSTSSPSQTVKHRSPRSFEPACCSGNLAWENALWRAGITRRSFDDKVCPRLVILVAVAGSAIAQEYFIVRGPDKKCKVVEKRPTEKTVVVIGDKAYVSKQEAEKQVAVVCKEK